MADYRMGFVPRWKPGDPIPLGERVYYIERRRKNRRVPMACPFEYYSRWQRRRAYVRLSRNLPVFDASYGTFAQGSTTGRINTFSYGRFE